jgi:TolB protein
MTRISRIFAEKNNRTRISRIGRIFADQNPNFLIRVHPRHPRSISWLITILLLALLAAGCGGRGGGQAILYLRPGPAGTAQLFRQNLDSEARQLTGVDDPTAPEVLDFAVSPDGARVVYAVSDGADGSALRLIDSDGGGETPLLACPAAECSGPVWSPDGQRLIYERRPWEDDRAGSSRLYWLDATTGETLPLIEGSDRPAYGARFSPDGEWISYVSPGDEGVVLYRPSDGAQRLLSSRVGSPAAWSPDGATVVVGDTAPLVAETGPEGETSAVYLYRTLVNEDSPRERLSPDGVQADSAPAFSPDGQWIAFGRAPSQAAAGRQLWLMRPDGGEARALTNNPAIYYGPPSWSADGRYLLYQRFDLNAPGARPAVWVMEVGTGKETHVAEGGYLPEWGR